MASLAPMHSNPRLLARLLRKRHNTGIQLYNKHDISCVNKALFEAWENATTHQNSETLRTLPTIATAATDALTCHTGDAYVSHAIYNSLPIILSLLLTAGAPQPDVFPLPITPIISAVITSFPTSALWKHKFHHHYAHQLRQAIATLFTILASNHNPKSPRTQNTKNLPYIPQEIVFLFAQCLTSHDFTNIQTHTLNTITPA